MDPPPVPTPSGSSKASGKTIKMKEEAMGRFEAFVGMRVDQFLPNYLGSNMGANKLTTLAKLSSLAVQKGLNSEHLKQQIMKVIYNRRDDNKQLIEGPELETIKKNMSVLPDHVDWASSAQRGALGRAFSARPAGRTSFRARSTPETPTPNNTTDVISNPRQTTTPSILNPTTPAPPATPAGAIPTATPQSKRVALTQDKDTTGQRERKRQRVSTTPAKELAVMHEALPHQPNPNGHHESTTEMLHQMLDMCKENIKTLTAVQAAQQSKANELEQALSQAQDTLSQVSQEYTTTITPERKLRLEADLNQAISDLRSAETSRDGLKHWLDEAKASHSVDSIAANPLLEQQEKMVHDRKEQVARAKAKVTDCSQVSAEAEAKVKAAQTAVVEAQEAVEAAKEDVRITMGRLKDLAGYIAIVRIGPSGMFPFTCILASVISTSFPDDKAPGDEGVSESPSSVDGGEDSRTTGDDRNIEMEELEMEVDKDMEGGHQGDGTVVVYGG
ncbi:hypothetical protein QBC33DRAFT_553426 [Phialemonium atrogriseum]|uniref:Uncharacterized protein n=1 Tax=Phialemonium atrogriseum TaxID=1093897 RepID=A0AAJ0BRC9_9PEZI|nr:uncharacterized protein QBC33DRAFT_553426 [Phialemonium atrogriseum]KAK1761719.1 hypothetical protein QBC33DRAFT_553426 [Phialemonium atrogriseum]